MYKIMQTVILDFETESLQINPTTDWEGVELSVKTIDGKLMGSVYMDEGEMELLIAKMRDMMSYVTSSTIIPPGPLPTNGFADPESRGA